VDKDVVMRLIAWLTVVASLVLAPLAGCATCPNGRCTSQQVVDECCDDESCDDECSQCGSDGIQPNGFPCDCCGPQLCNPFTGQPVRTYFSNIMTCGGGCSEVYWGEWLSDPPDPCDPCVNLGNCSRRGFLTNFWDTIANGDCSDDCCEDDCTYAGHDHATPSAPRLKTTPPNLPLDPAPAPPSVSPEDTQPDQKAVRPRRVIRR